MKADIIERKHLLNMCIYIYTLGLEWKLTFSSPVATAEFSTLGGTILPFSLLQRAEAEGNEIQFSAAVKIRILWQLYNRIPNKFKCGHSFIWNKICLY